jgi:biotin carboxyl carrier protein
MKMEFPVTATEAGQVQSITVEAGAAVAPGQEVLRWRALSAGEDA